MLSMNALQVELEIEKIVRAMMTRNTQIGTDIIGHLRTELPVEVVAGLMIVSIERLLWFDIDSVMWTIKYLIADDVMQEIKKITTFTLFQQLINKGFTPGKEFSVDAMGKLLLNDNAKTSVLCRK